MKNNNETNLWLNAVREQQKNNQRFMLIMSVKNEKVLSVWNNSQNCDYMLYDMSKNQDDIYACLYDSKSENKKALKEALDFIDESGMKLVGNTSWIPSFSSQCIFPCAFRACKEKQVRISVKGHNQSENGAHPRLQTVCRAMCFTSCP